MLISGLQRDQANDVISPVSVQHTLPLYDNKSHISTTTDLCLVFLLLDPGALSAKRDSEMVSVVPGETELTRDAFGSPYKDINNTSLPCLCTS